MGYTGLDYYKRQTQFLDNGADAYKLSSDFYISGKYLWPISEDWHFDFGLDLGLSTFVNTEPRFSANYQQNIINNGEVTFIDSDTKSPFSLSNMEFSVFLCIIVQRGGFVVITLNITD